MILDDYIKTSEVRGNKIMLDLRINNLFGFHKSVDKKVISSMLKSIARNEVFPPVRVVMIGNNCYCMTFLIDPSTGKPDGGHHRAYAHYLAGTSLKCEIAPSKYRAYHAGISIRDMIFREEQNG